MDRRKSPSRPGFTLVEVLIVILIIGTLIGLLLPAVQAAFRKAKEAQASAELNNLAIALADFKQKFGDYPPSRVLVCEGGYNSISATVLKSNIPGDTGNGSTVSDITYSALAARSALYLNKFWPRADFYSAPATAYGSYHDFNGNGSLDTDPYVISGAECLVFFLGGISTYTGSEVTGLSGFSRSPLFPFVNQSGAANRTVPLYEFVGGRLRDIDHDGIPTYLDVFSDSVSNSIPYAYFSAYGTNAYDPNDVNDNGHSVTFGKTVAYGRENIELDESTTAYPIMRQFSVAFPPSTVISTAPNPYTTSAPVNASGANYFNPNTFQLFCAGQDRLWGLGGVYLPNAGGGTKLPIITASETNLTSGADYNPALPNGEGLRIREHDNLTNFSSGRLD